MASETFNGLTGTKPSEREGSAPAASRLVEGEALGLRRSLVRRLRDGLRNFHAKTTAIAKPATAPREPALWIPRSKPMGDINRWSQGTQLLGFVLKRVDYLVAEEEGEDVGDLAIEVAREAPHKGADVLRHAIRHRKHGRKQRAVGIGEEGRLFLFWLNKRTPGEVLGRRVEMKERNQASPNRDSWPKSATDASLDSRCSFVIHKRSNTWWNLPRLKSWTKSFPAASQWLAPGFCSPEMPESVRNRHSKFPSLVRAM